MNKLYLLYHELRSAPSAYSYVMETARFKEHCQLFYALQANGDEVLRPGITFDDGHVSNYTLALPILHEHALSAHFFVTAGWIGRRAGFMDWAQLRDLLARGYTIGTHGMTHKLLTHCNRKELDDELLGARQRLEDGLGHSVTTMSLPGGRANENVLRACGEAGYTEVFTSVPKAEPAIREPRSTSGRLNVRNSMTADWLNQTLRPESGILKKLERQYRYKTAAKSLLGDRLYARIWATLNRQETESEEPVVRDLSGMPRQ